ncbi:MAG TPA: hypothetical protein ENN40_10750 [Candidatus Aminicenantes bacterium]|nr:hypothetical protein [Candidatus Aminicenantes bacterium]
MKSDQTTVIIKGVPHGKIRRENGAITMEERLYEIQRFYVQSNGVREYEIEFLGRGMKVTRLTFKDIEGVEFRSQGNSEIQTAFCNLDQDSPRLWNVQFAYPVHLSVRTADKVIIQVR